MKFLTRRLVKLTQAEIDTLLKADTIISDIKTKMKVDMIGNDCGSISLISYFDYDESMPVSYILISEIDRILYALANSSEIVTEVNDEGDEDGQ